MSTTRTLFASILFTLFAMSASAQAQPTSAASMPMAGTMLQDDCAKPKAKHDHGAEKGTPRSTSKSGPCVAAGSAAAPNAAASSPKKQLKHDHAKTHKTM